MKLVAKWLCGVVLVATPCLAANSARIFDFMGATTEEAYVDLQNERGCSKEGEKTSCYGYASLGEARVFLGRIFVSGKLYSVIASFEDRQYLSLLQVLRAKYGAPDDTKTQKWQSKGGAVFDNTVMSWRFKGGDLELSSMGGKIGDGQLTFFSAENAPKSAPPPVNF